MHVKPHPNAIVFGFANGSKYWVWEADGRANWKPISPGLNGEWGTQGRVRP